MKNTQLKTRDINDPYEVWYCPQLDLTWHVLKKWQADDDKQYARWYTGAKSPMTYGQWEYGDVYVSEIKQLGRRIK